MFLNQIFIDDIYRCVSGGKFSQMQIQGLFYFQKAGIGASF